MQESGGVKVVVRGRCASSDALAAVVVVMVVVHGVKGTRRMPERIKSSSGGCDALWLTNLILRWSSIPCASWSHWRASKTIRLPARWSLLDMQIIIGFKAHIMDLPRGACPRRVSCLPFDSVQRNSFDPSEISVME